MMISLMGVTPVANPTAGQTTFDVIGASLRVAQLVMTRVALYVRNHSSENGF